jgi:hypothetical protein
MTPIIPRPHSNVDGNMYVGAYRPNPTYMELKEYLRTSVT